MMCERCQGMMVAERFYHLNGESFDGKRCTMCGDIVDELIRENRCKGLSIPNNLKEIKEEVEMGINWMGGD